MIDAKSTKLNDCSNGPKAVIISDLRPGPVAAALQLFKQHSCTYLLCSEKVLKNIEYGGIDAKPTKIIFSLLLRFAFGLEIIRTSNKTLYISDGKNNGVLSSLTSRTTDFYASRHKYQDIYRHLEAQEAGAHDIWHILQERRVTEIFIYNGRLASTKVLSQNSERAGVTCNYYEHHPHDTTKFRLLPFSVHNFRLIAEGVIKRHIAKETAGKYIVDEERAELIINNKINGKFSRFTNEPVINGYDYAIFLSSPHEMKYVAVAEGADDLAFSRELLKKIPASARVCIRVHPNMRNDPSCLKYQKELEEVIEKHPNVHIISAFDGTNSHDLIRDTKYIFTNYSSTAIDAALLKDDWTCISANGNGFSKYLLQYVSSKELTLHKKRLLLALLFDDCRTFGEENYDIVSNSVRRLLKAPLVLKALR